MQFMDQPSQICLFCGVLINREKLVKIHYIGGSKFIKPWSQVKSLTFGSKLELWIKDRSFDDWAMEVSLLIIE